MAAATTFVLTVQDNAKAKIQDKECGSALGICEVFCYW